MRSRNLSWQRGERVRNSGSLFNPNAPDWV